MATVSAFPCQFESMKNTRWQSQSEIFWRKRITTLKGKRRKKNKKPNKTHNKTQNHQKPWLKLSYCLLIWKMQTGPEYSYKICCRWSPFVDFAWSKVVFNYWTTNLLPKVICCVAQEAGIPDVTAQTQATAYPVLHFHGYGYKAANFCDFWGWKYIFLDSYRASCSDSWQPHFVNP